MDILTVSDIIAIIARTQRKTKTVTTFFNRRKGFLLVVGVIFFRIDDAGVYRSLMVILLLFLLTVNDVDVKIRR
jgi:hypothetical protein